jgi:hypothetical protein
VAIIADCNGAGQLQVVYWIRNEYHLSACMLTMLWCMLVHTVSVGSLHTGTAAAAAFTCLENHHVLPGCYHVLPGCHGLFFLSFNLCTRRMFLDA